MTTVFYEDDKYRIGYDSDIPLGTVKIDTNEPYGGLFLRYGTGQNKEPQDDLVHIMKQRKAEKRKITDMLDLCSLASVTSVIISGVVFLVTSGIVSNIAGITMIWNVIGGIVSAYVMHDYEIK